MKAKARTMVITAMRSMEITFFGADLFLVRMPIREGRTTAGGFGVGGFGASGVDDADDGPGRYGLPMFTGDRQVWNRCRLPVIHRQAYAWDFPSTAVLSLRLSREWDLPSPLLHYNRRLHVFSVCEVHETGAFGTETGTGGTSAGLSMV